LKGAKILKKDRFKWSRQSPWLEDSERRRLSLSFLRKGFNNQAPSRDEFTAYGQASLAMVRGMFRLLASHDAKVFAAAIPRGHAMAPDDAEPELLRKDMVFLLERYYYLLEDTDETGLIVLDETDKQLDRRFVRMLERYFKGTAKGRTRSSRIVPSPMFVASDMAIPVQVADIVIYAINWGYRIPGRGMDSAVREEVADEFSGLIGNLQYKGRRELDGSPFSSFGIFYVPDLYKSR